MISQSKSELTLQIELETLNAILKRIAERGRRIRTQAQSDNEQVENESPTPPDLKPQEIKQDSN